MRGASSAREGRRDGAALDSRLLIVGACALAGLVAGCGGSRAVPDVSSESVVVSRVVDGDTLHLADGRRVRLVQIDAPETSECYADEATAALRELTPAGSRVDLEHDPGLDDVDEHGRLLRYVLVDGTNVNMELVEDGAAAPYFFRSESGRFADELVTVAGEAHAAGRGFWGACPDAVLEPGLGALTGSA